MRRLAMNMAGVIVCAALAAAPARAQMAVIDPENLAQNLLQAGRALEQVHNQVRQIDQQARMLAANPLQLSPELSASIARTHALFEDAQGIAFDARQVGADLRELYPETWERHALKDVLARTDRWIAEDRRALERAMRAEAEAVRAIEASRARIDAALAASSGAEGQTGAVQAGNQLLGVQATQLADIQALLAAQGRALSMERMERAAREARALEIQRRAFPGGAPPPPPSARSAF